MKILFSERPALSEVEGKPPFEIPTYSLIFNAPYMKTSASITFHPPVFIQGQGRRENQEDAFFPLKQGQQKKSRCWIVCDGVGGQRKGEVASQLLAREMGRALNTAKATPEEQLIIQSLRQAELQMKRTLDKKPECTGMATTLTVLLHAGDQLISAHVGDSRIYHFRKGKILHRSTDHSLVAFLLEKGSITEAEAATHPQRNVITRSVNGLEAAEPDIQVHTDMRPGDIFLLCTDGILEAWPDADLQELLKATESAERMGRHLAERCAAKSKDNYTACVLQVADAPATLPWWKRLFTKR
jgi:PPM family protein phosphatase